MLVVIGTACIQVGSYISNYIVPYHQDHDDPNNRFNVDQKFKMTICHYGNSLSSLGEALKTMN
jgi:hypothetical protein